MIPSWTSRCALSIAFVLGLFIAACGPSEAELTPTVNPDAIRTEAVQTFAFALTQTSLAEPTATPTPTPSPTLTPTAIKTGTVAAGINTCYGLVYVADVTIPDNTKMEPGESFTKTWKVQNTGSCAWAPGFKFSLVGGDGMGGQALTLTQPVQIGATTELSIDMSAPTGKTGPIQGTWRMADTNGVFFGDAVTVVIVIGGGGGTSTPGTATPTPTPTTST